MTDRPLSLTTVRHRSGLFGGPRFRRRGVAGLVAVAAVAAVPGLGLYDPRPQGGQAVLPAGTLVASQQEATDLRHCPDLRRGRQDPVNGENCVRAVQAALKARGYPGQAVTGRFLEQTEANLLDYQRRHGIRPVSGIAGPQTRASLTAPETGPGGEDEPQTGVTDPPRVTTRDYTRTGLSWNGYQVYVRRSTTRAYASWMERHPWLGETASSALVTGACRALKLSKPLTLLCQIAGDLTAADFTDQLRSAAHQDACLQISIGLYRDGATPRLLRARPDDSARCPD